MIYGEDPYTAPEKHGLTTVGEVEWRDEPYEFDLTAVWRDQEKPNDFYYADDSGCSCPSPFEDFHDRSQLTGPVTVHDVLKHLSERAGTDIGFQGAAAELQGRLALTRSAPIALPATKEN